MAKERSKVADYAVYFVVRVVICFIQMLSYPAASKAATESGFNKSPC